MGEGLDKVVEESSASEARISQLEADLKGIKEVLKTVVDEHEAMKKVVTDQKEKILANERHTRGFCLRFNVKNVREADKEDTAKILTSEFAKVGLKDIAIENSHRVGKKRDDGSSRQIIARFHSRPQRNLVLKKRKDLFKNHVQCFEDLCKEDLVEKRKHAERMQELFDEGKKVFFSRGHWFVDGEQWSG